MAARNGTNAATKDWEERIGIRHFEYPSSAYETTTRPASQPTLLGLERSWSVDSFGDELLAIWCETI